MCDRVIANVTPVRCFPTKRSCGGIRNKSHPFTVQQSVKKCPITFTAMNGNTTIDGEGKNVIVGNLVKNGAIVVDCGQPLKVQGDNNIDVSVQPGVEININGQQAIDNLEACLGQGI